MLLFIAGHILQLIKANFYDVNTFTSFLVCYLVEMRWFPIAKSQKRLEGWEIDFADF